jgi:hypothetical protein
MSTLEPSGPVRVCNGIALPFTKCTLHISYNSKNLLQITQLELVSVIMNNNECEWDATILTRYIICTVIFKYL